MKIKKVTCLIVFMLFLAQLAGCGGTGNELGDMDLSLPSFECLFFPYDSQCRSKYSSQSLDPYSTENADTNIHLMSVNPNQVDFIWNVDPDHKAYDGYDIYRNGEYLDTVFDTFYEDVALTSEITYCYTLFGFFEGDGDSVYVGDTCVTTPYLGAN